MAVAKILKRSRDGGWGDAPDIEGGAGGSIAIGGAGRCDEELCKVQFKKIVGE